jgi:hypothetical protein
MKLSSSSLLSHNFQSAWRLSSILIFVTLVQSAIGAFFPTIFHDPPMSAGNAQGTDVVILFVAIPALVISTLLAARGSLRAQIVWAGMLSYILYNAVLFAFDVAFNSLFLLYVATLSLALWSLVALLVHLDVESMRARFSSKMPVRAFAGYLLLISVIFFVTWMRQILPALFVPTTPAFLHETNMLTSPVHVLDLGFALPLGVLGAVWLWQRKGWGYLLAGLMLSMMTIETASIAVDQFFGHLSDPTASPDAVPLFVALTLIGFVVIIAYLRYLHPESNQKAA